jgi:predicted dehydrogenase
MHGACWQNATGASLAVVVDIDARRASQRAGRWGGIAHATDYRAVLADPAITICDICLPHSLHAPVAIDCLRAGKHVLLEKPIALTLDEAAAIAAAERQSCRTLMVAENCYYAPVVTKAEELIGAGALGELHDCRAHLEYPGLREWMDSPAPPGMAGWRGDIESSGGGFVFDGGMHLLSVTRLFMGDVESVVAMEGKRLGGALATQETTFHALVRFVSGMSGSLHFVIGGGRPDSLIELTLLGSRGLLEVDLWSGTLRLTRMDKPSEHRFGRWGGFAEEIAHFLECIRTGARPRSDSRDQTRTLALALAAYESARNGSAVVRPGIS